MDLELATLRDISEELLRRKASFCLIAKEATNRRERSRLWVSGEGIRRRDLMCLARFTDRMFARKETRNNRPTDSDTE